MKEKIYAIFSKKINVIIRILQASPIIYGGMGSISISWFQVGI